MKQNLGFVARCDCRRIHADLLQPATKLELVFQFRLAFFLCHGVLPLLGKYPVADCLSRLIPEKWFHGLFILSS